MAEFEERLVALEEARITLRDLPLAALQRKLEQDWQPEPGVLFSDALRQLGVAVGTVTLDYVASADSSVETVMHGLGVTPRFVVVSARFVAGTRAVTAFHETPDVDSFDVFGRADAAFSGSSTHYWLAIK